MLGRTRIHTRARGSGAGAGSTTTTDLQRILALSPSLLVWPANGAGWQGTSGGTLAASGQPLGLGADLSQLGGKTLAEWLAAAPELVTNGGFASNVDGWGDLGSWTAGSVAWSASGAVVTVSSFQGAAQQVSTSALNKVFVLSFDVVTTGNVGRVYAGNAANPSGSPSLNAGTLAAGSYTYVFQSGYANLAIGLSSTSGSGDVVYDNISIKELPGSHLRAGTWASPSDAARGTFQNNAINLDGVNDYYSLLNAISITTNMTVVRAFKRASAGIRSFGLGSSTSTPHASYWFTDNKTYTALGSTQASTVGTSTSTGSFVDTTRRNASTEIVRRNGVEIFTRTAASVAGAMDFWGRTGSVYNNGELSFEAHFPTELTGANLALVEQIAAATNGSVLA